MKKINLITLAITSTMFSGYLFAADASSVITFEPGTTQAENGQMVSYNGECFIAKNNPGVWEAPQAGSWFWDAAECPGETTDPEKPEVEDPEVTPPPPPTVDPETTPDLDGVIEYIPGSTEVKNGDMVLFDGQCFVAKNNPGVWESPQVGSWFWDLIECSGETEKPETGEPDTETPVPTSVSILAPTAGQTLTINEAVSIKVDVKGSDVAKVEFWLDNTKLADKSVTQGATLYTHAWTPTEAGAHTVSIYALDKNNKKLQQQSVAVTVAEEAVDDFTAPSVSFVTPANNTKVTKGDTVAISLNASDVDNDLARVVVQANNQQVCDFDANATKQFSCNFDAATPGNVTLKAIATDAEGLSSSVSLNLIVEEAAEPLPPVTEPGGLCEDFNVYPDWVRGDHATGGDIMVYNNIAYSALYWTSSIPGSDATWALHLNCDGSAPGTAPVLSLPNPMDPVRLEVAGWPNTFVVAGPTAAATETAVIETIKTADLTNADKLTQAFASVIEKAAKAKTDSIIITTDVLDEASKNKALLSSSIDVKGALLKALDATGQRLDSSKVNALSNDLAGWAQAHNLIVSSLAPNASFGWQLSIGDFAFDTHSGRNSVWNAASVFSADLLDKLALYKADSATKADFISFTKSSKTPALTSEQWHNALEYVKQVTDFIKTPGMLASIPTAQAADYFLGKTAGERQIRKAAHSNVFALSFDENSASLTAKIKQYEGAKVPLYYVGKTSEVGDLTVIEQLNRELIGAEDTMNNTAFLYETPESQWVPSTVYKWGDFLEGLNAMHNIGVAGNKFWLLDPSVDDATNIKYAKIAIAAFLAQSMQETIRYNACDENNWAETRFGAVTDYPMTASCGQLEQKYADYGVNPVSGLDHAYSCPRDNKMELSALTHAKWYGAPAPVFAAPNAVLQERGLLVNGSVGRWTNEGHCNDVPENVDTSKQVWERDTCKTYVGQKAGKFLWDGSSQADVEGCGWWGRGVIQTTGRQNFGTLNHYLGRSHVNPDTIGKTIDGVVVEAPPANPLYSDLDFCSNPGLICSSEENKEIKWIAGLFYWVTSVQAYTNEGGPYADWNYFTEIKKYVDNGLQGSSFIDDVSGIVNRGCPDTVCSTGEVHNVKERRENFRLVLEKLGLNPQL